MQLIKRLSSTIQARLNCLKSNPNSDWIDKHETEINHLVTYLPHGSSIDSGCTIDLDKSNGDKVTINTSFHHMDENGYYDGWTEHKIIVTPSFNGLNLKITGNDRNMIKEYLYQLFNDALTTDIKTDVL